MSKFAELIPLFIFQWVQCIRGPGLPRFGGDLGDARLKCYFPAWRESNIFKTFGWTRVRLPFGLVFWSVFSNYLILTELGLQWKEKRLWSECLYICKYIYMILHVATNCIMFKYVPPRSKTFIRQSSTWRMRKWAWRPRQQAKPCHLAQEGRCRGGPAVADGCAGCGEAKIRQFGIHMCFFFFFRSCDLWVGQQFGQQVILDFKLFFSLFLILVLTCRFPILSHRCFFHCPGSAPTDLFEKCQVPKRGHGSASPTSPTSPYFDPRGS